MEAFKEWCVLELLGHRRLGGFVSEVELFGVKMVRIDIPMVDGATATQFYGAGSVYCLSPTSEENARAVAARNQPQPVHRWELPGPVGKADSAEIVGDDGYLYSSEDDGSSGDDDDWP